jgi:hypothetical protein
LPLWLIAEAAGVVRGRGGLFSARSRGWLVKFFEGIMIGSTCLCGGVIMARCCHGERASAWSTIYAALAQLCASIRARERARNKESAINAFSVSCDLCTPADTKRLKLQPSAGHAQLCPSSSLGPAPGTCTLRESLRETLSSCLS